ncbi:MAG: Gmad2 immunoglobulin-like domain-containing protein [Hyphomonadaceae bacterium]
MIRYVAFIGLMLAACAPEAKPPEQAAAPAVEPAPQPAVAPLAADEIPAPAGEITMTSPVSAAKVTSPLAVEGVVANSWMFEGVFPVELAIDGEVISQAPAQQQALDNWTNPGPVRFKAVLTFDVAEEKNAVLILKEDSPKPASPDSDVPGPARTLRIPVVLVPAAK